MKKLCLILATLVFIFSFGGCGKTYTQTAGNSEVELIVMPDSQTAATVNGYKTETESVTTGSDDYKTDTSYSYYANTSTKKFHLSSCGYAQKIKEENLLTTNDRDELVNSGYEACKKCNP